MRLKIETAISVSMGSPLKAVGPSRSPETREEPLRRQLWPFGIGRLKTSGKDSGMGDYSTWKYNIFWNLIDNF